MAGLAIKLIFNRFDYIYDLCYFQAPAEDSINYLNLRKTAFVKEGEQR